jgi:hypothetical protein
MPRILPDAPVHSATVTPPGDGRHRVGDLRKEITNSPTWMSVRQGGDNLSRKARILASAMADREVKTIVDDPAPVLVFRFDGDGWSRWSPAWRAYEAAALAPPLRDHLAEAGIEPAVGDRFTLDAGTWRQLRPDEPETPSAPA